MQEATCFLDRGGRFLGVSYLSMLPIRSPAVRAVFLKHKFYLVTSVVRTFSCALQHQENAPKSWVHLALAPLCSHCLRSTLFQCARGRTHCGQFSVPSKSSDISELLLSLLFLP